MRKLQLPFVATALLGVTACSIQETAAPPFTGPSELALRVHLQAVPDNLVQDGTSQSDIWIDASRGDGRPVRGLGLRIDVVFAGVIQDFGIVSAKQVFTGEDGRARVTYTAPPRPLESIGTINVVKISVTPVGLDFRGEIARTVELRLIPPGVVLPPNSPPRALFTFTPPNPEVLTNVVFDASTSVDEGVPCPTTCVYTWDFGDGTTGAGVFTSHPFRIPGTFLVRLTVVDDRGASGSIAHALTVEAGTPPTASFTYSPASPSVGQSIFLTGEASRAAPSRRIVSYDWNFGSGRTASGMTTSTSYTLAGSYVVTLSVTDDAGRRATVSQTVTVRSP